MNIDYIIVQCNQLGSTLHYVGHETTTVDTNTRRKFTSPEARAHEQEYNEHLILVVCTWDQK